MANFLIEKGAIKKLINEERIFTCFQPVVSVKNKAIIGFEALCRGIHPETKNIIPPVDLFEYARDENMVLDLDRLCRKKAVNEYTSQNTDRENFLLFINLDASIIGLDVVGSGNILNLVNSCGLDPMNVVIEVVESKAQDVSALENFIGIYKNYGFLIALDDIGSGYSNFDRILLAKPDILKIDRQLISNIDKSFYNQEIFKSLVSLSKKIGSLIVAEGVEREEDALAAMELGADLLQGFYFSKPAEHISGLINSIKSKIADTADKFNEYMINRIKSEKVNDKKYKSLLDFVIFQLSKSTRESFYEVMYDSIIKNPSIECIYIIDKNGIQITETVFPGFDASCCKRIYKPAEKGADHSLKEYFYYLLHSGSDSYVTQPYISLASGSLCVTISSFFEDACNNNYIVCIDVKLVDI